MSMNWTQYLLSKLAEEAVEVAKEAMKCQQQGVASQYKGRNAIFELRNELIEVMAVAQLVGDEVDVVNALGHYRIVHLPSESEDDDFYDIKFAKVGRLFYHAMFAYQAGTVDVSRARFQHIKDAAIRYGAKHNLPYCGDIAYREV